MIRQAKHLGKNYLIVDTNLQIIEDGDILDVPVHIQVNITKIDPTKHYTIYNKIYYLFNHPIVFSKVKKPWYKFW